MGDPTEGALLRLALKAKVDLRGLAARLPRVDELPFDSATKLMATFHHYTDIEGKHRVGAYVKGAPDVLLARSSQGINPQGKLLDLTDEIRLRVMKGNDYLAEKGMRVLAFAGKWFEPETFDPHADLLAGENLVLYLLSKHGYECATLDHVGIDLIARLHAAARSWEYRSRLGHGFQEQNRVH